MLSFNAMPRNIHAQNYCKVITTISAYYNVISKWLSIDNRTMCTLHRMVFSSESLAFAYVFGATERERARDFGASNHTCEKLAAKILVIRTQSAHYARSRFFNRFRIALHSANGMKYDFEICMAENLHTRILNLIWCSRYNLFVTVEYTWMYYVIVQARLCCLLQTTERILSNALNRHNNSEISRQIESIQ